MKNTGDPDPLKCVLQGCRISGIFYARCWFAESSESSQSAFVKALFFTFVVTVIVRAVVVGTVVIGTGIIIRTII